MGPDGLRVATRHYYWKPSHAFFHAFELEAYADAAPRLRRPVLDLGCGDGTFGAMLRERGLLEAVDAGVEISPVRARRAAARGEAPVLRADARRLPLRTGAFGSVVANSVLNALPGAVEECLAEVHRVLAPDGTFVLTIPTAAVDRTRLLPRLLRRAGAGAAAGRLQARLNRRLDVLQVLDESAWMEALERARFRVDRVLRYFTPRQARWTNALTLQPFRAFALLRLAPVPAVGRAVAAMADRVFRPVFETEREAGGRAEQGASILVLARKPGA